MFDTKFGVTIDIFIKIIVTIIRSPSSSSCLCWPCGGYSRRWWWTRVIWPSLASGLWTLWTLHLLHWSLTAWSDRTFAKTWNIVDATGQLYCIKMMNRTKNRETSFFYLAILYQKVWVFDSNICPIVHFVVPASWRKVKDDIVTFCIAQSVTEWVWVVGGRHNLPKSAARPRKLAKVVSTTPSLNRWEYA